MAVPQFCSDRLLDPPLCLLKHFGSKINSKNIKSIFEPSEQSICLLSIHCTDNLPIGLKNNLTPHSELSSPLLLLLASTTARSMMKTGMEMGMEAIMVGELDARLDRNQWSKPTHHHGQYGPNSLQDCICVLTNKEILTLLTLHLLSNLPLSFHPLSRPHPSQAPPPPPPPPFPPPPHTDLRKNDLLVSPTHNLQSILCWLMVKQ